MNATWFEFKDSNWIESKNITIQCVDDSDRFSKEDAASYTGYEQSFIQDDENERQKQNIIRSQTNSEISIGRDFSLEIRENDPRDMFFILKNWNQTWHSHKTGMAVKASITDRIFGAYLKICLFFQMFFLGKNHTILI